MSTVQSSFQHSASAYNDLFWTLFSMRKEIIKTVTWFHQFWNQMIYHVVQKENLNTSLDEEIGGEEKNYSPQKLRFSHVVFYKRKHSS